MIIFLNFIKWLRMRCHLKMSYLRSVGNLVWRCETIEAILVETNMRNISMKLF